MKFNKIIDTIKLILEVLIGLHWLWNKKPESNDNSNEGTNTPQQDNNATEG